MPLRCSERERFLTPYVDGVLPDRECAEVRAHLDGCAECRSEAAIQTLTKQTIRRAAGRAAPTELRSAIRLQLAEEHVLDAGVPRRRVSPRTFELAALGFSAAAAAVVAAFAIALLRHPGQAPIPVTAASLGSPLLLEDGVALHSRPLPLDIAGTDATTVQRWLSDRMETGVHLPRFDRRRAPMPALRGARLSTVNARPAAVVTYTLPPVDRRVSLLIVEDPSEVPPGAMRHLDDRDVWMSQARGYRVASWKADDMVYSLISDLDEPEVVQLVGAVDQR